MKANHYIYKIGNYNGTLAFSGETEDEARGHGVLAGWDVLGCVGVLQHLEPIGPSRYKYASYLHYCDALGIEP